jgi:hypothetical protein
LNRLEISHATVSNGHFDPGTFYLAPGSYDRLPKSRQHDVVNPAYYNHGNFTLPWIYDLLGFIGINRTTREPAVRDKIEQVLGFVLTPAYQQLVDGYGVVMARENKGYAMGWSIHLPGFSRGCKAIASGMSKAKLLLLLDLMGTFKVTRSHPWYRESIAFLEQYRTSGGRFILPRDYIDERASGYWVNGAYMGMGEDRGSMQWRECLSTYWMLKLSSHALHSN